MLAHTQSWQGTQPHLREMLLCSHEGHFKWDCPWLGLIGGVQLPRLTTLMANAILLLSLFQQYLQGGGHAQTAVIC